jgi:hypothetical protein
MAWWSMSEQGGYFTKKGREIATVIAIGVAAFAMALWGNINLLDSINAAVLAFFWLFATIGAIRALYLPVQFIRHRHALRRVEAEDAAWEARAAAGDSVARVRLACARSRGPHEIPWYRW